MVVIEDLLSFKTNNCVHEGILLCLEPIPKFGKIIASHPFCYTMTSIQKEEAEDNNKHVYSIISIPDDLWNEIRKILPKEKAHKTVGRPIVPYRKVLDGILYVLSTGCQWKMLPREYDSNSTSHRRFQEWNKLDGFKKT